MLKKMLSVVLAIIMLMSLNISSFASITYEEEVTTFIAEDGNTYEFIRNANPVKIEEDNETRVLLGVVRLVESDTPQPRDNYREWTEWEIYDHGVTTSNVSMSSEYFMASVARGATKTYSTELSQTVKAGVSIPNGLQNMVSEALEGEFTLEGTTTYTKSWSLTLEGPDTNSPYNSRRFYYKLGYDKHRLTITENYYSNWDGLIGSTEHTCYGYEPIYVEGSRDVNV